MRASFFERWRVGGRELRPDNTIRRRCRYAVPSRTARGPAAHAYPYSYTDIAPMPSSVFEVSADHDRAELVREPPNVGHRCPSAPVATGPDRVVAQPGQFQPGALGWLDPAPARRTTVRGGTGAPRPRSTGGTGAGDGGSAGVAVQPA